MDFQYKTLKIYNIGQIFPRDPRGGGSICNENAFIHVTPSTNALANLERGQRSGIETINHT